MSQNVYEDEIEQRWRAIDEHLRQRALWRKVQRAALVACWVSLFTAGAVMWWIGGHG
jgi:hypothetical protein